MVEVAAPVPAAKVIFLIFPDPASETNKFPAESKTIPEISLNWAWVLSPSLSPWSPFPITWVTFPETSILEILCLPVSPTNRFPLESNAKALGFVIPTSNLGPSSLSWDHSPLPAKVETTPEGVIFLITWFSLSATYKLPLESSVIPDGWANWALAPVSSVYPLVPDPAKVVTEDNSAIS